MINLPNINRFNQTKMCSMKKIVSVLLMMIAFGAMAQETTGQSKWSVIEAYPVDVTCGKTSNLIFSYGVVSVDRGAPTVLVQKAKHVNNILQLKAADKNMDTTNLSVVTADGKFYSFLVAYNEHPSCLNLVLGDSSKVVPVDLPVGENQAKILKGAELVEKARSFMHTGVHELGIGLALRGIYLHEGLCYFKLDVRNGSAFPFDVDAVRLFVADKHKARRSASQEKEIAVLSTGPMPVVEGNGHGGIIVPTKVFTVAPKQRLVIRLVEMDNGRTVQLHVSGKRLLRVKAVK